MISQGVVSLGESNFNNLHISFIICTYNPTQICFISKGFVVKEIYL